LRCEYGNIRGGTPPILYEKNRYIWFFHTYLNKTYYIGAYMTDGFFKPILITPPLLIGQPQPVFLTDLTIKDNVVYPCGVIDLKDSYRISMGINDYKIAFLDIRKRDLIMAFKPISCN